MLLRSIWEQEHWLCIIVPSKPLFYLESTLVQVVNALNVRDSFYSSSVGVKRTILLIIHFKLSRYEILILFSIWSDIACYWFSISWSMCYGNGLCKAHVRCFYHGLSAVYRLYKHQLQKQVKPQQTPIAQQTNRVRYTVYGTQYPVSTIRYMVLSPAAHRGKSSTTAKKWREIKGLERLWSSLQIHP